MDEKSDIWSLGVVLFEAMQTLKMGYMKEAALECGGSQQIDFRELSEDGRKVIIKQTVDDDLTLSDLICLMLSDIDNRPTAT